VANGYPGRPGRCTPSIGSCVYPFTKTLPTAVLAGTGRPRQLLIGIRATRKDCATDLPSWPCSSNVQQPGRLTSDSHRSKSGPELPQRPSMTCMRLVHTEVVADHRRRAPGRRGDQPHTRVAVPSLFRESRENDGRRPSMIISVSPSQQHDRQHARCSARATSDNFTIYEGSDVFTAQPVWRADECRCPGLSSAP
jgi:hypothetical protein